MSITRSLLDPGQIIKSAFDDDVGAFKVESVSGSLVPGQYDDIALTYIVSGNGAGQVGTVTYSFEGNFVATLTLTYDVSNRLIEVARS